MKTDDIRRLLPGIFQRSVRDGNVLSGVLAAMEALHANPERALENFDEYFDARRAPPAFLLYLTHWLDLQRVLSPVGSEPSLGAVAAPGLGHLRELIARSASLSKWRGTKRGLAEFLATLTGVPGFEVRSGKKSFHFEVDVPVEARAFLPLIERVIAREKPAYVTYEFTQGT